MDRGLMPARYAKALLDYSIEAGMDKQVYSNVKNFIRNFTLHPEVKSALDNPVICIDDKRDLIIATVGKDVCSAFRRFVELLIQNKREGSILWIALKFRDIYRDRNNIYYARLTTVATWQEEAVEKVKKIILNGRPGSVEFHYVADKNIIGGFVIEYDYNLLDASVLGQLKMIEKKLVERNIRIV
jgi:F-type H+-transporting ATPase subunit delta